MRARSALVAAASALALAGCGLKGPLYMPEKPGEVTTRPGPGTVPPAAPAPPAPQPGTSDKTGD
jgi:predicted small lipoprotein YifL